MSARVIALRPLETRAAELSDEALLAACVVEDSAALTVLYQRHNVAVHRFASRLLGPRRADADDLVQQVFLTAWKDAAKYRGQSAVRAWLFGITANLARRSARDERRRISAFERLSTWITRTAAPHDDHIARQQLVDRVGRVLNELPHDLRVAYVMCELEEVSGVEAARALGVRPGTMWRRVHEARKRLRDEIERAP
ncbi:MAG: RNA polymerase sigma factor [Myxococcota bacterium]